MSDQEKELPQATDKTVSDVRAYFTDDINQRIAEMTTKGMESLLLDLMNSPFWIAILKYEQARTPMLDTLLRTTNPMENPYQIAWAQGVMAGMCDLENAVIALNARAKEQEQKIRNESVILGS